MTTDQLTKDVQEFISYSRDFAEQLFSGVGFEGDNDQPLSQPLIDVYDWAS